ncbi:MAG: hypothetical protein Ct9H300mP21_06210 [Pseudomonadota bacterium]|nr:MAG: hypothetical protein Ct9H300mP21_06210 [Pseudomonadota bacterium]
MLYPLLWGNHESGEEIIVNNGRYGPYVRLGKDFFSLPKGKRSVKNKLRDCTGNYQGGFGKKAKNTIMILVKFVF